MTLTGPGIEAGSNATPVSLIDLASTIETTVGATHVPAEEAWQGRPLQAFIEQPEPERLVISEYHDGGSPTGFYMLRAGRWKLVYFAEDNPPLLFDLERDPLEMTNLAEDCAHAARLEDMISRLNGILDPEAVNSRAFADQARMVEALGGMEAILALPSFNHTPLE